MPSVYDGQYDEQAIVYRTRAILGRKGLRLNKLTGRQAEAQAKYGYGPYVIIGGTYGDKIVAEGLAIEGLETLSCGPETLQKAQRFKTQRRLWRLTVSGSTSKTTASSHSTGEGLEKLVRAEIFKKVWLVVEKIEKDGKA